VTSIAVLHMTLVAALILVLRLSTELDHPFQGEVRVDGRRRSAFDNQKGSLQPVAILELPQPQVTPRLERGEMTISKIRGRAAARGGTQWTA
jgi:hypothetical protein